MVGELIADRLEGRPKQVVEQQSQYMTVFYRADEPPPPELLPRVPLEGDRRSTSASEICGTSDYEVLSPPRGV